MSGGATTRGMELAARDPTDGRATGWWKNGGGLFPDAPPCIECVLLGRPARFNSVAHHVRQHGMTAAEYRAKYPGAALMAETTRIGYSDRNHDRDESDPWRPTWNRRYDERGEHSPRQNMISAIQRVVKRRGGVPSAGEWQKLRDVPRLWLLQKEFGSWRKALAAAGYECKGTNNR